MIKESESKILNTIDRQIQPISNELQSVTERINKVECVISEVNELKYELKKVHSKIAQYENIEVSCELRLNGIAYNEDENLCEILQQLMWVVFIDQITT